MDTDPALRDGLRQGRKSLQQTRSASLIGELVSVAKILFPSVFIRGKKIFPLHEYGLKAEFTFFWTFGSSARKVGSVSGETWPDF
jgi:hypothetical protein